jgi:hypothetical protein
MQRIINTYNSGGCRVRDRMVVGFTTTYAISAYHHWCCEFESRSGRGVQHERWATQTQPTESLVKFCLDKFHSRILIIEIVGWFMVFNATFNNISVLLVEETWVPVPRKTCLSTDQDESSNHYREPSIDASYQVLDHLAMRFQRRRFLEIGQSETRIACGGIW